VKIVAAVAVAVILGASVVGLILVLGDGSPEPSVALDTPLFIDETQAAGVDHAYMGRSHFFEGGGVAAFDCSGDGYTDLFFAGGEDRAALYRNTSSQAGELSFTRIDTPVVELESVTGGYPIDIDGDLITDLVVLRVGENVVFRGLGDCLFERANEMWSIDGGSDWTVGFSATWNGDDVFPTLAFGNYLKLSDLTNETDLCSPNVLIRPQGRTYGPPTALEPAWCSLSVLFSDWDRDGVADLRVTNDRQYNRDGEEQLWRVSEDQAAVYTREEGWKLVRIWGMGIASQDLTGDGLPEIFLTSQADNKLQTLVDGPESPAYADIAIRRGVTAHRPYVGDNTLASTAWHAEFQDVNNDGFIDLFIAKGNVDAVPGFAVEDPNNLLIGQPDGTFVEGGVEAGIVHSGRTRGAAIVDLNRDGFLDLVEVNREEGVRIWRNAGSGDVSELGNWVDIVVEQTFGFNSGAVGAVIELRIGDYTMTREITVGGGHASGHLTPHHFGMGSAEVATVRVIWPDGSVGDWFELEAGHAVVVARDAQGP